MNIFEVFLTTLSQFTIASNDQSEQRWIGWFDFHAAKCASRSKYYQRNARKKYMGLLLDFNVRQRAKTQL